MKFNNITRRLNSGEVITIREAQITDAEELRSVVNEYVETSEFIPYAEGEFNVSLEEEEKWIQSFIDAPNGLMLLAIVQDKIVGNISINGSPRKMMQHASCIGIGLLSEWRGKGIGSLLFESAIKWAKGNDIIERLWLETYANNTIGIALYEKFGFKTIGRHPEFIKLSSNEYVDDLTMTLKIK